MNIPKSHQVTVGQKFGRWTVVGDAIMRQGKTQRIRVVPCHCECGTEKDVRVAMLVSGASTSCSCGRHDACRAKAIHGDAKDGGKARLYVTWTAMKQRCLNPKCKKYSEYGGRGITVSDDWMEYVSFRDWALKNGYADDLQIDRIDNDNGYSPDNCRFVNRPTNQRNRRICKYFEAFGETKNLEDWLKDPRCIVSDPSLRKRLSKGMTFEEALSKPKEAPKWHPRKKKTQVYLPR